MRQEETAGIAVGVPGLVDIENQKVVYCPNLEFKIEKIATDLPVYMANDADLALLGKMALRDLGKNVALITLGTGVGGAFAIGDKLPIDFKLAGEIGHMKIIAGGRDCACGGKGCLEAYVSGSAILKQAKEEISQDIDSAEQVFDLTRSGGEKAGKIIDEMAKMLGVGIANLVNVLGVEKIILAGQIAKSADLFLDKTLESAKENIFALGVRNFSIEPSQNIDQIALFGGVELIKRKS